MITYFRMKYKEWKIKLTFYSAVISIFENNKEIIDFLKKLCEGLKDTSSENFQEELIKAVAGFAHDEALKERMNNE